MWNRYRTWLNGLNSTQRRRYRIFRTLAVVCAAVVLLWIAYSLFVNKPNIPAISTGEVSGNAEQMGNHDRRSGAYTFLVVGRDTGGGGSTDTMILATFDTKKKTLDAVSLPRDTMVNVSWNNKKLNTVYNYYKGKDKDTQVEKGMTALKVHVGKLTGILPDFYMVLEWDAVGELVDAIGGVTFDVPYDMHYDDPYQDLHIHQEKGERRLSGEDAMQVIRWRKNNGKYGNLQIGDSGRMKIQQDFLVAVAKECLQLKHLINASEFARIFSENVTTNLTVGNLVWFAQHAIGMNAQEDIRFYTMPYTPYTRNTAYVLPVVDEFLQIINDGLNPYKQEITAEDIEVLQLKGDGTLFLTSGTLEDERLAKPRKPQVKPEPTQQEQPPQEQPPQEQQPQPPAEGDVPAEEPVQGEPEQQPSVEGELPIQQPEQPMPEEPPLSEDTPQAQPPETSQQPEEPVQGGQQTGAETTQTTVETDGDLPAVSAPVQ